MARPKIKEKKVTMSITINDIVNEKLEKYFQADLCLKLLESDVGECKL